MLWRWILFGLCIIAALMFDVGTDMEDYEPEAGKFLCRFSFSIIAFQVGLIITQIIDI